MRAEGLELVLPSFPDGRKLGFLKRRQLKQGLALLEQVVERVPGDWSTLFAIAIHLRSLGEEERALERFRASWKVNPHRSDTGREYAAQCLRLGLTEEGIAISRDLHRRFPTDPTLEANLAVALLVGGDLTEAESVALSAESHAPTDRVTANIVAYIRK